MEVVAFLDKNGILIPRKDSLVFPFVQVSMVAPNVNDPLLCIGQPGKPYRYSRGSPI